MEETVGKFGYLFGIILSLALIALGILLIRKNAKSKQKANECMGWPTVLGRVTRSEVVKSESSNEDGTTYSYTPHIEYVYHVLGQNYTSTQVVFGGFISTGSPKASQLVVNKYPLNDSLRVFYNPANPREAILEQTVGSGAKGALIGGIILVIVGVLIAVPLLIAWLL